MSRRKELIEADREAMLADKTSKPEHTRLNRGESRNERLSYPQRHHCRTAAVSSTCTLFVLLASPARFRPNPQVRPLLQDTATTWKIVTQVNLILGRAQVTVPWPSLGCVVQRSPKSTDYPQVTVNSDKYSFAVSDLPPC